MSLPIKSQEQLYASLQRGLAATGALGVVGPVLAELREAAITAAISRFNSLDATKPYSERDALLFVAKLSTLDAMKQKLESIETDGRRDGKKLINLNG